jgi:hypothetical protein
LRAFIGFGNDRSEQEIDFYKSTGGIRGELSFAPDWRFDLYVSLSQSDGSYKQQAFLTDKTSSSVNVVTAPAGFNPALVRPDVNGVGVTCAINLTNTTENCIPAPTLSAQTIGGTHGIRRANGNPQHGRANFRAAGGDRADGGRGGIPPI